MQTPLAIYFRILATKRHSYLIFNNDITWPPKFPCDISENFTKDIGKHHYSVCCDICILWVHIKCNNITKFCYRKHQNWREPWYCKKCIKRILPFSELTDSRLNMVTKGNLTYSTEKVIQENNLNLLIDDCGTSIKNDCFIPTSIFYLHMNISSFASLSLWWSEVSGRKFSK